MEHDFSKENSKTELMKSALKHYTEKLRTIMVDSELGQHKTDYLKEDLVNEMIFAEKVRIKLHKEGYLWNSEHGKKHVLDFDIERRLIVSALQSYLNGLQQSKKTLIEKLGTTPNLEKLHHEIKFCDGFLDSIHKSYPEKTEKK